MKVDTDLVRAASLDAYLDECKWAVKRVKAFEDSDVGDSRAGAGLDRAPGRHAGAAEKIAGNGKADSGVILRNVAVDECKVGLVDLAVGEHFAKLAVGGVVFGDEDEAGGLLIEAMHDAGPEVAVEVGEPVEVVEERVDEGAMGTRIGSLGIGGGPGSSVDRHPGGFVDYGEVVVFEEDVERNVFRKGVKRCRAGSAFDLDRFAASQFEAGPGRPSVDADLAGVDEELNAGAGDVRDGLSEVLIKA